MLRVAVLASALAGCIPPPNTIQPSYFVAWVPVAPPVYYQPYYPQPVAPAEAPSLAVRALAGKISSAASEQDCANAIAAGDELEKLDADAHHAMLAIDQRYAACIRGL